MTQRAATFIIICFALVIGNLLAPIAQEILSTDNYFERASLFRFREGDVLEDYGVITVPEGFFARREAFEVVRHPDGGRTVTSVSRGLNNPYRVEGRWLYDSDEQAVSAIGKASYNGLPVDIEIIASPPSAIISIREGIKDRSTVAPCNPDCLIDLAPSALPMFTMTRQFKGEVGDTQTYRWIAQALIVDESLLDGRAELRLHKTQAVSGEDVSQYTFVETMKNAQTGKVTSFAFNLYVGADHSPLAFVTEGGTTGTRAGFETLIVQMPPKFGE